MIEPLAYVALTIVAVVAGFVEFIAGGGGLIMHPALLFAGVPPLYALGTNKLQSVFGTAIALRNYGVGAGRMASEPLTSRWSSSARCWRAVVKSSETRLLNLIIPFLLSPPALYVLLSPRMTDEDAHHRFS